MHLQPAFTSLLLALSATLSFTPAGVDAAPKPSGAGVVTVPLKRAPVNPYGLHPHVHLQHRIHHSLTRLARVTRRAPPTHEEMHENLRRRALHVEELERKRRKRQSTPPPPTEGGPSTNLASAGITPFAGPQPPFFVSSDPSAAVPGAAALQARQDPSSATPPPPADAQGQAGAPPPDPNQGLPPAFPPPGVPLAPAGGDVSQAVAPTGLNSLGMSIFQNDGVYLATILLGTPPKPFRIVMDSGSADFWVGSSTNCTTFDPTQPPSSTNPFPPPPNAPPNQTNFCGNHPFLGNDVSSSFVSKDVGWSIIYGTGGAAGTLVQDDVNIAGMQMKGLTFGVANLMSGDFTNSLSPCDGLMGTAQSVQNTQNNLSPDLPVTTPIDALASQSLISAPIVAYRLARLADGQNDGEVSFGGLDPTKFNPAKMVTFPSVSTEGFWEGEMSAVSVGGKDLGLKGRTAILDTGTSLAMAPPADATAFYAAIPGSKPDPTSGGTAFTLPCSFNSPVSFTFSNMSFTVDPRDIRGPPLDPTQPNGDCFGNIMAGTLGGPSTTQWLLGDVFLKNVYFATDAGKREIVLAGLF